MHGVVRTHVGYTGGTKKNPSYHNLWYQTEAVRIEYYPKKISYEALLDAFWSSHDPTAVSWSTQYKSVILYHTEEQKKLALATKTRLEEKLKRKVLTEILPAGIFYFAEDYHQKYMLRGSRELVWILNDIYPSDAEMVASTAAARLNGYISGLGKPEDIERELQAAGLSKEVTAKIIAVLNGQRPVAACPA
jgi:peptide-methionine (S)-S-oxide reductase